MVAGRPVVPRTQAAPRTRGDDALLLIFLISTWFTVQFELTGIVRFVVALERTEGSGLHIKFSDGIEKVTLVPTARVLKEDFGFGSACCISDILCIDSACALSSSRVPITISWRTLPLFPTKERMVSPAETLIFSGECQQQKDVDRYRAMRG